jgi:methionyl-tRNA formyltransferase
MRIALFTGQDVGRTLAEHFAARSDPLVLSFDSPHHKAYGYRSALEWCRSNGVKHIEARKADERVMKALEDHRPDVVVSCWYARILPPDMLRLAPLAINVHPGKLPYYKGRWPTPWYILNGEQTFGIAVHKMIAEVDAGDVYVQREYPIPPQMTGHELIREAMRRSGEAIIDSFDGIVSGEIKAMPQAPGGSRYDHIEKTYTVDWTQPAEIINRHIRVHARPYEPAKAIFDGKPVYINRATPIPHTFAEPGTIVAPLTVACGRGSLVIDEMETIPAFHQGRPNDTLSGRSTAALPLEGTASVRGPRRG